MKNRTLFLSLILISMSFLCLAQSKPASLTKIDLKYGKVTPADFELKPFGNDTAASALKIFDIGELKFEVGPSGTFIYVYERHIRYKVLNKNGLEYGNYSIGLESSSNQAKETLETMNAATYNLESNNVVVSKLTKESKFTDEVTKNYVYKKFALPNVKEGSILEFKFKIKSDFIFTLRGWNFQSDIPTLYSEYKVIIPEYLRYKFNHNGFINVKNVEHKQQYESYIQNLQTQTTHDKFVAENVPALKSEPFIANIDDYISSLDFELRSTHFPNSFLKDYTSSWPQIVTTLVKEDGFGAFLKRNSFAKSNIASIIKDEKDSLLKANLIFNYVKNNIKWNKSFNLYASENNTKNVFDKKTGNSADINLSLITLLKEANLNAEPVLVSTRNNGKHPGFPTLTKFNSVIAHVTLNGQTYLLDATMPEVPFGMIQYQNLNHEGLFVNTIQNDGGWINIEPMFADESTINYTLTLNPDNSLQGFINRLHKGYKGYSVRNKYKNTINQEDYIKDLKNSKSGLSILNYKIENLDNPNEDLMETMDVEIEDQVESAGNLIYFNPLLFERTQENPFKYEERLFAVDFAHPIKENFRMTINIPENLAIEKLPSGGVYKLPDNSGSFTIQYISQNNTILVRSNINLNKSIYSADEYFDIKALFQAIVDKQGEQIVLKKKV